jgi:hypothetical protein
VARTDPIQALATDDSPRLATVTPLFGRRGRALQPDGAPLTDVFALARVVGSIHVHSPALAADLEDAVATWLELNQKGVGASDERADAFRARCSRLRALLNLLATGPYQADPRD